MGSSGDYGADYIKNLEQAQREGRIPSLFGLNKVPKKGKRMNRLDVTKDTPDFGFTAVDSTEVLPQDNRAAELYAMIIPLLNNLKKNPEKDMILWPNRVEKIDEFIVKMNRVMDAK